MATWTEKQIAALSGASLDLYNKLTKKQGIRPADALNQVISTYGSPTQQQQQPTQTVTSVTQGPAGTTTTTTVSPIAEIPMSDPNWPKYAVQQALINSIPGVEGQQLRGLFDKAVAQNWDPSRFSAELQNTEWYKKNAANYRTAEAMKYGDPATWQSTLSEAKSRIQNRATQLGFKLTDAEIDQLADSAMHTYGAAPSGFDQQFIDSHIVQYGDILKGGQVQAYKNDLKKYATNMGLSYNDDWYNKAASAAIDGTGNIQEFRQAITDLAKSQYRAFEKQIDAGLTIEDIASPYRNKMASILEINPESFSLNDPHLQQALNGIDKDGNPSPMSLWQFEKALKDDPRWRYTKNARDSIDSVSRSVLRDMGLAY